MLKKHLKINETALAVIVLLIIGAIFVNYNQRGERASQSYKMPVLNLPLRYFPDSDIGGGICGDGCELSKKSTMSSAYIDGGYRSFPTKTITLSADDFSNSSEQLPLIKSMEQIMKQDVEDDAQWQWLYKQEIKEYGDLATRFLPSESVDVKKFDVDNNGKDETIVFLCSLGGNHCPHRIKIIKDGVIIFSVNAGLTDLDLIKSETGNGFYVHWVPIEKGTKWDTGLCCPPGHISTRFVYEDGKFKPVYEQEVLYFEVKNTEP